METFNRIAPDVSLGRSVKIFGFANLYGCTVGDESRIGCFVEIQKNAIVGARCKISSHSFICEGVTIEDDVFIGHHVCFINSTPTCVSAGRTFANGRRLESDSHSGQTPRDDWVGGGHSGRSYDWCRSHRWCRGGCDQERRPARGCRRESRPPPTYFGRRRSAVKVRVSLKGSDRFTQWWPGGERDFLPARTVLFGKARRPRHEWQ